MSEVNVPAQPPVLDISDLRVAYGARTVVDGVSFQIHRGEIFGLLGPNGAGKTSTLSAIEGLVLSRKQIGTSMRSIGLEEELGKRFKQLSGGQQQRLALFIATIHNPLLLLLDEPTAGLDPQSRRGLWRRIEELRSEGNSILLTTHSMEEAQAVCDRVAIIDHGVLLTIGKPSELIDKHRDDPRVLSVAHGAPTLEDVFIGLTGSEIRD